MSFLLAKTAIKLRVVSAWKHGTSRRTGVVNKENAPQSFLTYQSYRGTFPTTYDPSRQLESLKICRCISQQVLTGMEWLTWPIGARCSQICTNLFSARLGIFVSVVPLWAWVLPPSSLTVLPRILCSAWFCSANTSSTLSIKFSCSILWSIFLSMFSRLTSLLFNTKKTLPLPDMYPESTNIDNKNSFSSVNWTGKDHHNMNIYVALGDACCITTTCLSYHERLKASDLTRKGKTNAQLKDFACLSDAFLRFSFPIKKIGDPVRSHYRVKNRNSLYC